MSLTLTTGGLGFIGSHTCINLLNNGQDVLVIDSLVNSSNAIYIKIKNIIRSSNKSHTGKLFFIEGDIKNAEWLDTIFKKQISLNNPITSVIHFAGLKSVEESVNNPLKYWRENIDSTISLLSSMNRYNCSTIVFSSSATIYKPTEGQKLVENSLKEPINPYGNTKITIEKILKDLYLSNKEFWKIINLRYFNPVGAHDSGIIGEEPMGKATNLFPILAKVIRGELDEVSIFGNDWPTKDGTCIRDFIHIMDLSEAHYSALKYLQGNKPQFTSLNVGTGIGHSVLEVINKYGQVNGIKLPYKIVERRDGDAPFVVADNSLALEILEWKAQKTLEDMCIDSYRFISKRYDL